MPAQIIDGKQIAREVRGEIKLAVERLKQQGIEPGLAVVQVGENLASQVDVNSKHKACGEVGMYSEVHRLLAETTQEQLVQMVQRLNQDSKIHGILVQLPLPDHIDAKAVIDAIALAKDVDGFGPSNGGGVGPMTITMLLNNTLQAAKRR